MAERVWMVDTATWQLRLMWGIDAKEALRLGYQYAPVGGVDPPTPPDPVRQAEPRPEQAA